MPSGPSYTPHSPPLGTLLRGLLLAAFLIAAFPAGAQVVISEFVADNLLGR